MKTLLILILMTSTSFAEQIVSCGGGYTDKYGITWSPTGTYTEPAGLTFEQYKRMMKKYCPEKPSISPESCTCALNSEPPEGTPIQEIHYWVNIRNKYYDGYTGQCSKKECKEMR